MQIREKKHTLKFSSHHYLPYAACMFFPHIWISCLCFRGGFSENSVPTYGECSRATGMYHTITGATRATKVAPKELPRFWCQMRSLHNAARRHQIAQWITLKRHSFSWSLWSKKFEPFWKTFVFNLLTFKIQKYKDRLVFSQVMIYFSAMKSRNQVKSWGMLSKRKKYSCELKAAESF